MFPEQKDWQGNPTGKSLRISAGVEVLGCFISAIHIWKSFFNILYVC